MMDADTELRLLEEEFPKSSKVWATDTDAALDQRILSIADRTAPYLAQQHIRKVQDQTSTTRGKGTLLPIDAKSTPLDPRLFSAMENYEEAADFLTPMSKASMDISASKRQLRPPGAEKILKSLEGADQQAWLDGIADVVKAGDIELATYLLRRYRIVFRRK